MDNTAALFAPKLKFLRSFKDFCNCSVSGSKNQFFRPRASKKAPRTLCLSVLLRGSPQGPFSEPNERLWGSKPQNGWNFIILGQNGVVPLYRSWCLFKMSSISLGILNVLACRKSWILWIFHDFHEFHEISWNFMKKVNFHDFYEFSWICHGKWKTHPPSRHDTRKLPKPL